MGTSDDSIVKKIRRVFGKGYAAGVAAATAQLGESMTPARMQAIEQSLNGYAKKVLAAIPIKEAWTLWQITSEMRRQGANVDQRVLTGCLTSLKDNGLVKEVSPGSFIRIAAREKEEPMANATPDVDHAAEAMEKPMDPLERLGELADRVRGLAADIENVAIEIATKAQQDSEANKKMAQLKSLLKELQ